MSKVFAFILGMLFGIIVICGAVFACIAVVTPDMVTGGGASDYVGDFGKMSLLGMFNKFKDLYTNYTGCFYKYVTDPATGEFVLDENGRKQIEICTTDDGEYFTLGMFCATTGIDLDKVLNTELPQSVYSLPLLEYFNGSNGVSNAMSQIKVSTIPDIVNLFAKTDESGNKIINQAAVDKLAAYSLTDLLAENGLETVFAEVKLSDIASSVFPVDPTEEGKALMYAVGQATVGKALGAFKRGEILPQLKAGGAFEEIGKLKVTQLVDSNETIQNIFGNTLVSELVNDEGKFDVDKLLDTTKIGGVLGYTYDEVEDKWYKSDSAGNKTYADGIVAAIAGLTIREVMNADELQNLTIGELLGYERNPVSVDGYTAYGTLTDVMTDGSRYAKKDGDKWYEAKLNCTEEHEHTSDCFTYIWYTLCTKEGAHADHADDVTINGKYYVAAEPAVNAVCGITIKQLTNDAMNVLTGALLDLKISDIIPADQLDGTMASLADMTVRQLTEGGIDTLYFGQLFDYARTEVADTTDYTVDVLTDGEEVIVRANADKSAYIRLGGDKWYTAKLVCDNTDTAHVHDKDCYGFVWTKDGAEPDGIQATLANYTVGDVGRLNDIVKNLTLGEVMASDLPARFESLRNVKISELGTEIDKMTMADFLNYTKGAEVLDTTGYTAYKGLTDVMTNGTNYIKKDGEKWYVAILACTKAHTHTSDCFTVWTDSEGNDVTGISAKLADTTVAELSDIQSKIKTFTLRDVMGDDLPTMLASLADTPLDQLDGAVKNMLVGDMLEYTRTEVADLTGYTACGTLTDVMTNGTSFVKKDGDKWYVATQNCDVTDSTHVHTTDCFDYKWKDNTGAEVSGVLSQIAGMTIVELQDGNAVNDKIQNMKLGDVMTIADDERPLGALKNTKIKDLGTSFKQLTLGDVIEINGESSLLLRNLKDKKLDNISGAIDDLTIKEVIEVDPSSPKLLQTLANKNTKISELGTAMNDLKLSDVIDTSGNPILRSLEGSNINNLGNDLNGVQMGTVLNYTKIAAGECTTSGHSYGAHWHDDANNEVKGVYAKIADMTIEEISTTDTEGNSGLEKIMLDLSLGDLVDSGIMDIGTGDVRTQNEYKLRIMTCNDPVNHSFKYSGTTFNCNLAGFFSYKAALQIRGETCTAEEFYNKTHGTEADKAQCLDLWKNVHVKDFMSSLLGGF